jgi:signal transduction histidine kinase/iron only hydrogenase large subunit-like protein
MPTSNTVLVTTIGEKCRTCYTCVRECPAKAIRILDGQAQVLHERCIGCGNCVRVCSQGAKQAMGSLMPVEALLVGPHRVAAAVAPSFPAEFPGLDEDVFAGMLFDLGFDLVHEVGFGADLVARETRRLMASHPDRRYISSACPGIVTFVERYHPGLADSLLPVVSPMEADALALRELHGEDLRVVFIGPCIAKKGEAHCTKDLGHIDTVLTFKELADLLAKRNVTPQSVEPKPFTGPRANMGAVFPLSRGLAQAAGMSEDLATGSVVTADGRQDFPEALREFESGDLDANLLDVLCCNGCIMGAGMTTTEPLFRRRARVSRYASGRQQKLDKTDWQSAMDRLAKLDLSRGFTADDKRMREPDEHELRQILNRLGKHTPADELNCRACGYDTCRRHAVAIFKGMAESEMCLPYVIDELQHTVDELNISHEELANTQEQLMHSERLASMGQLAAGIAHEVNNPLGMVLLYAHLLAEQCEPESSMGQDLKLIVDQAVRCKGIVAGLLDFARQNKVDLKTVGLADIVDDALTGCQIPDRVELAVEHRAADLQVRVDADQLGQVIINLVNNAVAPTTGASQVTIGTGLHGDESVAITVSDNGGGIDPEILPRVFEPFFTTKEQGQGTGLGLAVSYGIVKMHRGDLQVESNSLAEAGPTGTTFTIVLPYNNEQNDETETIGFQGAGHDS